MATAPPHPARLTLSCYCGAVKGEVHPTAPVHVICHCDDCQNASNALVAANPETTARVQRGEWKHPVDEFGGTDILQVLKCQVEITAGKESVRLAKLKPSSPCLRAFASCCGCPLFNMPGNGPVVGVLTLGLEPKTALGPVRYRVQGKHAVGTPPEKTAHGFPPRFVASFITRTIFNRSKRTPCPVDTSAEAVLLGQ